MNIGKLKRYIVKKIEEEIPEDLYYHGLHHTLEVLETCNRYIRRMKIGREDAYLLRTAALMHDLGIMWNYDNHEEFGASYVHKTLPDWGYNADQIKIVSNLILATRTPQQPNTELENILCDADLDYLGTKNFHSIGATLFKELNIRNRVKSNKEWDTIQVKFLRAHYYHTDYARKYREPVKQEYLKEILKKWGWN